MCEKIMKKFVCMLNAHVSYRSGARWQNWIYSIIFVLQWALLRIAIKLSQSVKYANDSHMMYGTWEKWQP